MQFNTVLAISIFLIIIGATLIAFGIFHFLTSKKTATPVTPIIPTVNTLPGHLSVSLATVHDKLDDITQKLEELKKLKPPEVK